MSSLKPSRGLLSALLVGALAAAGLTSLDRAGAAEIAAMNYSPTSRTARPVAVFRTTGSVTNPQGVLTNQATRLSGTNTSITLDFGKETSGIATLSFGATSGGQQLGLSFTESSLYVGTASDISANYGQPEGALTASAGGSYTMPRGAVAWWLSLSDDLLAHQRMGRPDRRLACLHRGAWKDESG